MTNTKYIIACCEISGNTVYKNGKKVFENKQVNPQDFFASVYRHFNINYPRFYKMDNLSKLGWLASEILLAGESVINGVKPEDIGIVVSNANSSLDTDIKYLQSVQEVASPALFVYTLPNIVTGEICIRNNFKGENAFFIFEGFDAAFTEQYVSCMLDNNILQLCICGWVEFLKDAYKAVLFLAGNTEALNSNLFTKENLDKIFNKYGL